VNIKLTDYNSKEITVVGQCIVKVEVKGKQNHVRFVVVRNGPSLLGFETCERLNLVRRIMSVEEDELVMDLGKCTLPEARKHPISSIPFSYEIKLQDDAHPVIKPPRRVPMAIRESLRKELDRMEEMGVVHKQTEPTEWVNEMVVVNKPNGSIRVCIDPRDLNPQIKREHYQLPSRDEIFSEVTGAVIFSKLDASHAFWQVKLTENCKKLTTFNTPFGRYAYDRLPYGLCSAPEVFHKYMSQIFEGIEGTKVYMDDLLVWGQSQKEHDERMIKVKERIRKYNLHMNWDKCELSKTEIEFLGERLTAHGRQPGKSKIEAIRNMKKPSCKEDVQRLLGTINFVGHYIPNLSASCMHIRALLNKNVEWLWSHEHDREWEKIKEILATEPVLAYFDVKKVTKVSTDSSKEGLGAVLLQLYGDTWRPVAYAARSLTDSECRYAQIERECLGLVFGCQRFHNFIYGLKGVILETDHKPLISISQKPLNEMSPRIQRLMLKLQQYDTKMTWIPGKYLYIADTLSRSNQVIDTVQVKSPTELEVKAQVNLVYQAIPASQGQIERLVIETDKDESLQSLKNCINEGWRKGKHPGYHNFRDELSVVNGLILKGNRVVIPQSMRSEMLEKIHHGHLGAEKQKRVARQSMYWPSMNLDIDLMVQKCGACQKYRPAQCKETFVNTEAPETLGPWEKVASDLFKWNNKDYLLVIDYLSCYPEIVLMSSTTSEAVIRQLKSIFSRQGIPRTLVTDNGPQYVSEQFRKFEAEYQFEHITSSPRYPQSNGMAERGVGIVKNILNKVKESNGDPYLAMLAYRMAPREMGKSPAELLMNRRLRGLLPVVKDRSEKFDYTEKIKGLKNGQIERYNLHAKELATLETDDCVRVRNENNVWAEKAKVLGTVGPRSYQVLTEHGSVLRRNRRDLLKVKETFVNKPEVSLEDQSEWDTHSAQDLPSAETAITQDQPSAGIANSSHDSPAVSQPVSLPRRSGRLRKPVDRLIL
jgi:transposase InsO family protein